MVKNITEEEKRMVEIPETEIPPPVTTDITPVIDTNNIDTTSFIELTLKNKTGNKNYFRCGICIGRNYAQYRIPCEEVQRIKSDPWIEEKK